MNAINTFFDNLFGTHIIEILAETEPIITFDIGKITIYSIVFFAVITIATAFLWFFHIIFEKEKCK